MKKEGSFLLDADSGAEVARLGRTGFLFFQSDKALWSLESFLDVGRNGRAIVTKYDATTGAKVKESEIDHKGDPSSVRTSVTENGEIQFVSETSGVHVWDTATEKWTRHIPVMLDRDREGLAMPFRDLRDRRW